MQQDAAGPGAVAVAPAPAAASVPDVKFGVASLSINFAHPVS